MDSVTSRRAVRVIFGATLLWIMLAQYVLLAIAREEPYPALILPGFPANCPGCLLESGLPSNKNPELTVRFSDGDRQQVPIKSVLPEGTSVSLMAFTAAFDDEDVQSVPEAIDWLYSQVSPRFPDKAVVGIDITWRSATYGAADDSATDYAPLYTIDIGFGPTP